MPPTTTCKERYPELAANRALFKAARWVLIRDFDFPRTGDGAIAEEPVEGAGFSIGYDTAKGWEGADDARQSLRRRLRFASILGILISRNRTDPSYGRVDLGSSVVPLEQYRLSADTGEVAEATLRVKGEGPGHVPLVIASQFVGDVADAVRTFNQAQTLFQNVYHQLYLEGQNGVGNQTGGNPLTEISLRRLADIVKRLVDDGVRDNDPLLARQILLALGRNISSREDGHASAIDIDLPDLDAGVAVDIVSDNVAAVAAIYFSAMLEEMKLHAVAETVTEHFMTGMLPISRSTDGQRIYDWMRGARDRFSELERRSIYGRSLGLAMGSVGDLMPNREFPDLWIRFLSTVSLLARDSRSTNTSKVSVEQAKKAARDLAVNLSLHGYGVTHFAAVEMQGVVRDVKEMLEAPEVLRAYGVNDVWQLVDRVSAMYLGGAMNGVRYRTMAQNGSRIILWLARNAPRLASVAGPHGIDFNTETALINDIEGWLAVTGTPDSTVENYTDPVAMNAQPTIPNLGLGGGLGATVQDALNRVGLNGLPTIPQA